MDIRGEKKITPTERAERHAGINYAFQIDLEERLVDGVVTDISLKGIGGKIETFSDELFKRLKESNDLFIKIITGGDIILAGVRLVWLAEDPASQNTLKGGFAFSMLSPEDRVKLYSIIQKTRDDSAV